jgi:hypothetical protein
MHMSEDEFEPIMGIFEKVICGGAELLHLVSVFYPFSPLTID